MNKKGFTLIELLVVVALLLLLGILATSAIIKYYDMAKRKSFINEAQIIYKTAINTFTSNQLKSNDESKNIYCYVNGDEKNKLDINLTDDKYYKIVFEDNKIIHFIVYDSVYKVQIDNSIDKTEIIINDVNLDEIEEADAITSCN